MNSYNDDDVILVLTDPCLIEDEALVREKVSGLMSDAKIHNLVMNLQSSSVEVLTSRRRLVEQSSYFRGLLDGIFCESHLKHVPVCWSLEPFIYVLLFIHGYPLNITLNNSIPLLEAVLYFGVEKLLLECEAWFQNLTSGSQKVPVETIIEMWNFGLEHGLVFFRDTSEAYLARNFVGMGFIV